MLLFAPLRQCLWVADCAVDSFRHRAHYRSLSDAWKIFNLRLAASAFGRRLYGEGDQLIDVKLFNQKVLLRQRTQDVVGMKEVVEQGEYASVERWNLPEDANIIDLGGNIGLASLYFASLCPQGRLLTVEPDQDNLRVLKTNCRELIESGRLTVVQALVTADNKAEGADPDDEGHQERFACVSIPNLLNRVPMPRIDLTKCDIEGAEAELFKDCKSWIGRVENLIVEMHMPACSPEQLYESLRANGWEFDILSEDRAGERCTSALRRRAV